MIQEIQKNILISVVSPHLKAKKVVLDLTADRGCFELILLFEAEDGGGRDLGFCGCHSVLF